MLQPNQPMGQPNMAATGPQGAKPQQPQQPQQPQTAPAGSLMGMMPGGGIMAPIDKVANAYAGNPQALAQKGVSGDLLAQLAKVRLEAKLKAAENELQLSAAGQQDPNQKSTIDQITDRLMKREMDSMTKNEMQAEQMDTLQQKQAQQQEGQKRLMQAAMNPQQQGLGGIPAPNAAEPRAMAAGGIVAFDGGGTTTIDPVTGEPYTEEKRAGIGDWFSAQAAKARGFSPEVAEAIKLNPDVQAYVDKYGQQLLNSPDLPAFQRDPRGYVQTKQAEAARPVTQAQGKPVADTDTKPQPQPLQQTQQNAANLNRPAPIRNIAAVPGGGIAGDSRNAVLERTMIESMKQDPRATAEASRESAYKFLQPDEADMKARREGLASLQALNAAENDPSRQWTRRVLRALPSKGTSFMANTMGQLGEGALAARDEEYARQLAGIGNEQKMLKGIMEDVYKPKKEATDVGSKTEQFASSEKTHGMAAAAQIKNAEMQAAVSAANNAAMAAERALTRESNDANRNLQIYRESQANLDTALKNIDANYTKASQALVIPGAKPSKEQQAQIIQLQMDRDNARAALNERYGPLIEQAGRKAGMADGIGSLGTSSLKGYSITGARPTDNK